MIRFDWKELSDVIINEEQEEQIQRETRDKNTDWNMSFRVYDEF